MLSGYKTYIGLGIAAVTTIAPLLGFHVATGFSDDVNELADKLFTLIGLGVAFYGRLVAVAPGWFAKQ